MTAWGGRHGAPVLVTGASGVVGQALCAALIASGQPFRTLGRGAQPPIEGIGHVTADLTGSLPDVALDGIGAVLHLAAAVPGADAAAMEAVNHHGAARLADAAQRRGITRFVALSSIRAATGSATRREIHDDDPPRPEDAYGRSKLAGEEAIRHAVPSATILRPPLVLGAGLTGAMARLLRLARSPLPLPFARLTAPRSFIARSDLAAALVFALCNDEAQGRTALVAGDGTLSVAETVGLVRRAMGRPANLFPVPAALVGACGAAALGHRAAAALVGPLVVRDTRLRGLGWRPLVPLADAMTEAAGLPKAQ